MELAKRVTVLIVDDEIQDRIRIRNVLSRETDRFEVVGEAGSAEEALEIIGIRKPELVFTDIHMLQMSGLELAEQTRRLYEGCHVVIVAESREFEEVRRALRAGAEDFLLKPVEEGELQESVLRIGERIQNERRQNRDYHRSIYGKKGSWIIEQAAAYIDRNLMNQELSLKVVAAAIFVNESYLSRIFKREMGESLIEYITRRRIAESIRLLNTTSLKVYEIAERVGFRNSHYFSICFKKQMGMTVKEFRQRKKGQ